MRRRHALAADDDVIPRWRSVACIGDHAAKVPHGGPEPLGLGDGPVVQRRRVDNGASCAAKRLHRVADKVRDIGALDLLGGRRPDRGRVGHTDNVNRGKGMNQYTRSRRPFSALADFDRLSV